ncbi:MAG: hypothetical protein WCH39_10375 [Schlesneria sp.]
MKIRTLCICLFIAVINQALSSTASAQVKQNIQGADKPWLYEFVVAPAPTVQPAFKYRLLPDRTLRRPGNAATSYYRALYLFHAHSDQDRKEFDECYHFGFMVRPARTMADGKVLQQVPIASEIARVRSLVTRFADVFDELESASVCESCDWGIDLEKASGFEAIRKDTPQFVAMRQLARLVQQKTRVAIFDRKYDEAMALIQIGFQLGRDIAQCPMNIAGAIGIAISIEMQVPLMEMIAEPDSPNLYWALASAPRPMIDIRPGIEQELNLAYQLPFLRGAEKPHSPEEWTRGLNEALKLVHWMRSDVSVSNSKKPEPDSQSEIRELVNREYNRAKSELVQFGFQPEQLVGMPEIQVLAIHQARLGFHKRDEILKSIYLPFHQASTLQRLNDGPEKKINHSDDITNMKEVIPIFESQIQWIDQARAASVRLDCLLVRLQTIEALRMHAAANAGKLPGSLSEIISVPIPTNPITGQSIIYHLEAETAVLEFPSPNSITTYGEIIHVTLRKRN